MQTHKIISVIFLVVLAVGLASCSSSRKARIEKECDCGSFSKVEIHESQQRI